MALGWDQGLQAERHKVQGRGFLRVGLVLALLVLAACAPAPRPQLAQRLPVVTNLAPGLPAQPPRANTPGELVGLSSVEVAGLLGTPSLTRHDDPAEVWQYADGGCVLLVAYARTGAGAGAGAPAILLAAVSAALLPTLTAFACAQACGAARGVSTKVRLRSETQ